VVMCG